MSAHVYPPATRKNIGKVFALARAIKKERSFKTHERKALSGFLAALRSHDNGRVDRAISLAFERLDY